MVTAKGTNLRMSADEFLRFQGKPGWHYELVDREVVEVSPTTGGHGEIASDAGFLIRLHEHPRRRGVFYAAETGFLLRRDPDTVRAPDFAFVLSERLPDGRTPEGYVPAALDFVIEVASPGDSIRKLRLKMEEWRQAGTVLGWLVQPDRRLVLVYRANGQIDRRTGKDELDAEPVFPGFCCAVSDLFSRVIPIA